MYYVNKRENKERKRRAWIWVLKEVWPTRYVWAVGCRRHDWSHMNWAWWLSLWWLVPNEPPDVFSTPAVPIARSRHLWALQTSLRLLAGSEGPRSLMGFSGEDGTGHPSKDEPCLRQRAGCVCFNTDLSGARWPGCLQLLSVRLTLFVAPLLASCLSLPPFLLCPSPLIQCFRQSWSKHFYSKLIFLAAKLGSIKEKDNQKATVLFLGEITILEAKLLSPSWEGNLSDCLSFSALPSLPSSFHLHSPFPSLFYLLGHVKTARKVKRL